MNQLINYNGNIRMIDLLKPLKVLKLWVFKITRFMWYNYTLYNTGLGT